MHKKSIRILFSALFLLYFLLETLHFSHDHFSEHEHGEICLVCVVEHPEIITDNNSFILFIPFFFISFTFLNRITRKEKLTLSNKDPPLI